MSSKTQGKTKHATCIIKGSIAGLPCALSLQTKLPCPLWAGLPFQAGERLLVSRYALEAVSDAEVPLDQAVDLLDHQVGVLRERAQHIVERLKGRQRVQKVFHKLLFLLP